jgi:hydrogenase maturation protease
MPGLLVIGWGNPLRGDDAFGFLAAEKLSELLPGGEVLALHQLTPELMEPVSRAARVVFIDASAEGEPGRLQCSTVEPSATAGAFTHHATPAGLLAGAQALYGSAPPAVLYTVRGECFEFGEGVTAAVALALEEVVRAVAAGAGEGS